MSRTKEVKMPNLPQLRLRRVPRESAPVQAIPLLKFPTLAAVLEYQDAAGAWHAVELADG